jgi:hypothetical protein
MADLSFPALVPVPETIISNQVSEMAFPVPVPVPAPENNLSYPGPDLSYRYWYRHRKRNFNIRCLKVSLDIISGSIPVPVTFPVPDLSFPALVPVPEAIISNPVPEGIISNPVPVMAFPVPVPAPEKIFIISSVGFIITGIDFGMINYFPVPVSVVPERPFRVPDLK